MRLVEKSPYLHPIRHAERRDFTAEDLGRGSPVLAEAISRMRRGRVLRAPGFDGQFGCNRCH